MTLNLRPIYFFLFLGGIVAFGFGVPFGTPVEASSSVNSCPTYSSLPWSCETPSEDGGCGFKPGEFCEDGQCYIEDGTETCSSGDQCSISNECQSWGYHCDSAASGGGCDFLYWNDNSCTSLCNAFCDIEGDENFYCSGDSVYKNYDYCGEGCSGGDCVCDWDYNSCGDTFVENCNDQDGYVDAGFCQWKYRDYSCGSGNCTSSDGPIENVPAGSDTPEDDCSAGVCRTGNCDGSGSCGWPSDDGGCSTIDCSGYYVQTGTQSATSTETCYNKTDITSNRCEGLGNCKETADCSTQTNDTAQYSCGTCQFISPSSCTGATLGSCSNYSAGTPCGAGQGCDGSGSCVEQCSRSSVSITSAPSTVNAGDTFEVTFDYKDAGQLSVYDHEHLSYRRLRTGEAPGDNESDGCYITTGNNDCSTNNTHTFTITAPTSGGEYTYSIKAFAAATTGSACGLADDYETVTITVVEDTAPPTVSVAWDGAGSPNPTTTWRNTNATATISCSDASGCEGSTNWEYSTPTSNPGSCSGIGGWASYSGSGITITDHRWVCARARDTAGNLGYSSPVEFKVDKVKPESDITSPSSGTWQTGNFTVNVTDTDTGGSGFFSNGGRYHVFEGLSSPREQTVNDAERTLSSGKTISAGSGVTNGCSVQGENACQVQVFARDRAGNAGDPATEGDFITVHIDYENPSMAAPSPGSATTGVATEFTALGGDTVSGLAACNFVVDGSSQGPAALDFLPGPGAWEASFTHTFVSADTYNARFDCRDNAGNWLINTPNEQTVTVTDPPQCAAPASPLCSFNAISGTLNLQWSAVPDVDSYRMEWARWDKNYGDTTDTVGGTSRVVSGTSGNTFGLTQDTGFKLRVRANESGPSCTTPGVWSQEVECYTGDCPKTSTPAADTFPVSECDVTIEGRGWDTNDDEIGGYETNSSGSSYRELYMDDSPGGCTDNFRIRNSWSVSGNQVTVTTNSERLGSTTHTLDAGFVLSVSGERCSLSHPLLGDGETTTGGWHMTTNDDTHSTTFGIEYIECTSDSHCTVPGKTKCNLGDSGSLPQNTCIENEPPVSVIEHPSLFNPVPGLKSDGTRWLKAGSYNVFIADSDAEALDTSQCTYSVWDSGVGDFTIENAPRSCNSEITLTVGPGGECGNNPDITGCLVYADSVDIAGNASGFEDQSLNIDTKPPTAR